ARCPPARARAAASEAGTGRCAQRLLDDQRTCAGAAVALAAGTGGVSAREQRAVVLRQPDRALRRPARHCLLPHRSLLPRPVPGDGEPLLSPEPAGYCW